MFREATQLRLSLQKWYGLKFEFFKQRHNKYVSNINFLIFVLLHGVAKITTYVINETECIKSMSYSSYWWDFAFSFSEHVFCCFALILSVCCCISAIHILLKTFDSLQLHLMYSHGNKYWFNLKKKKKKTSPRSKVCLYECTNSTCKQHIAQHNWSYFNVTFCTYDCCQQTRSRKIRTQEYQIVLKEEIIMQNRI